MSDKIYKNMAKLIQKNRSAPSKEKGSYGPEEAMEDAMAKQWIKFMIKRYVRKQSETRREDANRCVDQILSVARTMMKNEGLDPLRLPDDHVDFREQMSCCPIPGDVQMSCGWMTGLSSLRRRGNALMDMDGDTWLYFACSLQARNIRTESSCTVTIFGKKFCFDLKGMVENMTVRIKAKMNINNMSVIIESFDITDVGEIYIKTDGIWYADWLITLIARLIIMHNIEDIKRQIEYVAMFRIEKALSIIDLNSLLTNVAKEYAQSYKEALSEAYAF